MEFLLQLIIVVFVAGGQYIAIRKDLKYLPRDIDIAHERLTKHLEVHHGTSD